MIHFFSCRDSSPWRNKYSSSLRLLPNCLSIGWMESRSRCLASTFQFHFLPPLRLSFSRRSVENCISFNNKKEVGSISVTGNRLVQYYFKPFGQVSRNRSSGAMDSFDTSEDITEGLSAIERIHVFQTRQLRGQYLSTGHCRIGRTFFGGKKPQLVVPNLPFILD